MKVRWFGTGVCGSMVIASALGAVLLMSPTASAISVGARPEGKSPVTVGCNFLKTLFATTDATQTATATSLASPNSPAMMYGQFQIALRQATRASGGDAAEQVTCKGQTVAVVVPSKLSSAPPNNYTAFKLDKKSRLSSFKVSNQSLTGRLLVGTGQSGSALGVTFKLAAAYQTISSGGDLVVVLDVTGAPGGETSVSGYKATYDSPSGQKVTASSSASGGSGSLAAGTTTTMYVQFPSQPIGGSVNIAVSTSSGNFDTGTATIPVK